MEETNTAFIIDTYNKYSPDKIVMTFWVNGREFCVKECPLEWGTPVLASIEVDNPNMFNVYGTLEEAKEYIRTLKQLEGARL